MKKKFSFKDMFDTSKKLNMKKITICFAAFLVCFCIMWILVQLTPAQPLPTDYDPELVTQTAQQAIEYFNNRDYQSILDMGDENLKSSMTAEEFAEQCDAPLDECGAFVEYKSIDLVGATHPETGEEYGGASIVALYENYKLQFSIGFNKDMELIQFAIQ